MGKRYITSSIVTDSAINPNAATPEGIASDLEKATNELIRRVFGKGDVLDVNVIHIKKSRPADVPGFVISILYEEHPSN
ncbi:hypothetical protein [Vagococcus acidifermentans]|uniref:Dodecin domain-containing protein n=1 Tax=Vagococcus acidifermentans TaxID=564710 RepID=A0A430B327_9ENTE|nr:hypothetical protein [Vagococcus acidifermentans]RSU14745.1 hypothetical protein CBF27_01855 [Vagococcus acidifermentans]